MAPIGAKLRENAFQTICNISCFDAGKKIDENESWSKIEEIAYHICHALRAICQHAFHAKKKGPRLQLGEAEERGLEVFNEAAWLFAGIDL